MEMESPTASETPPRRLRRSGSQHLESSLAASSKTSGKMFCPQGGRNEVEMLGYHSKRMQHNKYTTMDENVLKCAFEMLPPSMHSPMGLCSPVRLSPLTDQRLSTPRKISQVHKDEPNPSAFSCNPGRLSPKQQKLEPSPNKHVKIFCASKSASLHLVPSKSNMVTMDLKVSLVKLPSHNSQKTVLLSHVASETKPVALPPVDSKGKALTMDLRVSLVKRSIPGFQKNVPQNLSETNTGSQTSECPPKKTVSHIPTDSQANTVYPSPGSPLLNSDTPTLCTPLMVPFVSDDGCREKTDCMAIEGVSTLWSLFERNGCSTTGITKEHEKEKAAKALTPGINTRQYLSPFDQQCTPVLCSGSIIPVLASVGKGAIQSIARLRPALPSPMLKRRRLFRPEEVADLILEEPVMMVSREEKPLLSNTKCNNEHAVKLGLQDIHQVTDHCIVQSGVLSHDCKEGNGMWSSSTKSSDSPYPVGSRKRAWSPESLEFPMRQLSPVGKRRDNNKVLSMEMKNCPLDSAVSTGAALEQYNVSMAEPAAAESSKLRAKETGGLESDSDFLVASRTRMDPAAEQKEPPKADTEVIMDSEDEESGGSNKVSLQNYHKTKFNTYIPTFREHFRRTFGCAKKTGGSHGMSKRKMHVSEVTRVKNKPLCFASQEVKAAVL